MRCLVTGAAGFVGSTLTDRLLQLGYQVVGIDNLSTGRIEFLAQAQRTNAFVFHRLDLLADDITPAFADVDVVFHLAANADVRFGTHHPTLDFEQNTRGTINVLEAMRSAGVRRIAFSSTGSVYGEAPEIPTPEFTAIPRQTSLYGASKFSAEAFIEAYCEGFGMQAFIFRFVSLLGRRYTHGHVVDFVNQLTEHPGYLDVLGDGSQRKSYLLVDDCVDAILIALEQATSAVNVLNLGADEYCTVNDSIGWICDELGVQPERRYSGGNRGWIGDNPFIFLDCSAMRALGWKPSLTIEQSVRATVRYLRGA